MKKAEEQKWLDDVYQHLKDCRLNGEELECLNPTDSSNEVFHDACQYISNSIKIQFRNKILYLSLMFYVGWAEDAHQKPNEMAEGKIDIFSVVDALQISLLLFRAFSRLNNPSLRSLLNEDPNKPFNTDNVTLRGFVTGIADYLVAVSCKKIITSTSDEIKKARKDILEWYLSCIERIYREQTCIFTSTDGKNMIEELAKIWNDERYISIYSFGRKCAGKTVDADDKLYKEFEFYLSYIWLSCLYGKKVLFVKNIDFNDQILKLIEKENNCLLSFCNNNIKS